MTMPMQDRPLSRVCSDPELSPNEQKRPIEALLRDGANLHETDKNGVTPLHHAVRFRLPTAVRVLLKNGADVNRCCKRSGSSALHRAVTFTGAPRPAGKKKERTEIIRLLMKAGADTTIKNKNGKSAFDYATDDETRALLS